jgi:hypothetical protein
MWYPRTSEVSPTFALGQLERAKPNLECPNPNTLLGARFLSIFYLRPSTYSSESSPLHISTHLSIAIMSDNIPTPVMPIIPPLEQRMQLAVHKNSKILSLKPPILPTLTTFLYLPSNIALQAANRAKNSQKRNNASDLTKKNA